MPYIRHHFQSHQYLSLQVTEDSLRENLELKYDVNRTFWRCFQIQTWKCWKKKRNFCDTFHLSYRFDRSFCLFLVFCIDFINRIDQRRYGRCDFKSIESNIFTFIRKSTSTIDVCCCPIVTKLRNGRFENVAFVFIVHGEKKNSKMTLINICFSFSRLGVSSSHQFDT